MSSAPGRRAGNPSESSGWMRMKPRNGTCQISAAAVQRPSQMACCEGLPAHRAVAITCNGCAIHSPASKMRFRDSGRQGSLQVPGRSRLSNAFRVAEKFDDVAGFVLGISLIHGTVTVAEVRSLLENWRRTRKVGSREGRGASVKQRRTTGGGGFCGSQPEGGRMLRRTRMDFMSLQK